MPRCMKDPPNSILSCLTVELVCELGIPYVRIDGIAAIVPNMLDEDKRLTSILSNFTISDSLLSPQLPI